MAVEALIVQSFCLAVMIVCAVVDVAKLYSISKTKLKAEELDRRLYKLEVAEGVHDERDS